MAHTAYVCTDPSHPPLIPDTGGSGLYGQVREAAAVYEKEQLTSEAAADLIAADLLPRLGKPTRAWNEWSQTQHVRRMVASEWSEVFARLENLAYLTGWFMNDCAQESSADELHPALWGLAFEANRTLFVGVHQLRGALAEYTFGYLRTLHELYVKSHFVTAHAHEDPDLAGRLLYYTNTTYLEFYRRFSEVYQSDGAREWVEDQERYAARFGKPGTGDYWWAFPLIKTKGGEPNRRPTLRHLMDDIHDESAFRKLYYDVSTSKAHGDFVWNPLMAFPDGRRFPLHAFDATHVGIVVDLMMPMFDSVVSNVEASCVTPVHATVRSVVKKIVADIGDRVATVRASNPDLHLGLERSS